MSDNQENPNSLDPHPNENTPGCGIASYGCLLLFIFLIGLFGIISSTLAMFQASFQRKPFSLVPGNQVEVWRLQPMRDAGLLELTEIPIAYHDESRNGSSACALNNEAILRLDRGQGWRIPYTEINKVTSHRDNDLEVAVVHTKTGETLSCVFAPGEGAGRFTRAVKEKL